MIPLLRVASFIFGLGLLFGLPFMLYAFAAMAGELENIPNDFLLGPLAVGMILGLGPVVIGLPNVVAGAINPRFRLLGGVLLAISTMGITLISINYRPLLVVDIFYLLLFFIFVWPANRFIAAKMSLTPDAPSDGGGLR